MKVEWLSFRKKSVQTTVSLPIEIYFQLLQKAKRERKTLSQLIRLCVFKEFGKDGEEKIP